MSLLLIWAAKKLWFLEVHQFFSLYLNWIRKHREKIGLTKTTDFERYKFFSPAIFLCTLFIVFKYINLPFSILLPRYNYFSFFFCFFFSMEWRGNDGISQRCKRSLYPRDKIIFNTFFVSKSSKYCQNLQDLSSTYLLYSIPLLSSFPMANLFRGPLNPSDRSWISSFKSNQKIPNLVFPCLI